MKPTPLEIAVYYYPQYHPDPRNDRWHGKGWTEWELVKRAEPRFPGHHQPRVPAWGYTDESDPVYAEKEINLAADHGVTAFLFDYYHYDDGPFLEGALENGFLQAPNSHRLKFALMWANHDWHDWFPTRRFHGLEGAPAMCPGMLSPAGFERFTDKVVAEYFSRSNYLHYEGRPYFSIWDIEPLIRGHGGLDGAVQALDRFRAKAWAAGHAGIHFNAMQKRLGEGLDPRVSCDALGIDSVTDYNWHDRFNLTEKTFPATPYTEAMAANIAVWTERHEPSARPYVINVTTGFDSTPRCNPAEVFDNLGYPWVPVLVDDGPDKFAEALVAAREYFAAHPAAPRILTLNAWNEWTEGAYLLPDTRDGLARLEKLREVFPPR